MTSPTVVLVPGAWHTPALYEPFVKSIPDIDVRTVRLPSSGLDAAALGDMYSDAAEVRKVVASIDGPVLVLAHSYGGVPVTEALDATTANVRRIVYAVAFMLDEGESMVSTATQGGRLPLPATWSLNEGEKYVTMADPEPFFYGVEPALARWAVDGLTFQSWASLVQPLTNVAWRAIPSTYVVADEERELPAAAQQLFAQRAGEERHIASGHSPFLSKPADLAAILREELSRLG